MKRFIVSALALVFMCAIAFTPRVAAQDATPPAGIELAPGVFAEVLSGVPSDRAEGQTLYLARFTFLPGQRNLPPQSSGHDPPFRRLGSLRLDIGQGHGLRHPWRGVGGHRTNRNAVPAG